MNLMKTFCLVLTGLGVLLCILPGLVMLAFGAALAVLGVGGFVSLYIMEGESSDHIEYGENIPFLFRLFRKKREREYCPTCGARLRFLSGLGPFAGLAGGWYCSNCKREVSAPTRSPEYRRERGLVDSRRNRR